MIDMTGLMEPEPPKRVTGRCESCGAFTRSQYHRRCNKCASAVALPPTATCPKQEMLISEWRTDEHGNLCRTITGV
jgi:hypothetical protein